jgi:hypothetical protein
MKGMLDIPEGFNVPVENEGEMFIVPVEFTIMGGKLLPIAIDGIDLPASEEEMEGEEMEGEEMEGEEMEGEEMEAEGEEEEKCPECGEAECKCGSEGMGKGVGGFMVAIEKALGKGQR